MGRSLQRLRRFLRAPWTIMLVLAGIVGAGVTQTVVPQVTERAEALRFAIEHPTLGELARVLALDRVTHSAWFLALVLLAAAALLNVLVEQWRRLAREWRAPLDEHSFRAAPYRQELERRAGGPLAPGANVLAGPTRPSTPLGVSESVPAGPSTQPGPTAVFTTSGRLGLAGTPLFHLGLMAVVLAGAARALTSSEAVVELTEGETLAPEPGAYLEQWPAPLGRPFALAEPVRLERLVPRRYPSGALESLTAALTVGVTARPAELGINAPLDLGVDRLYLTASHGPAALLTVRTAAGEDRQLVLLRQAERFYEGSSLHEGGLRVKLRGEIGADAALPQALEVRVLKPLAGAGGELASALLFVGPLAPGEEVALATGERVALSAVRYWVLVQGSRDLSAYLAWVGFTLVGLGAALMFTVVKVDTAVIVTPVDGGERVVVALKANRFSPIFAERFERLVRQQRGDAE